MGPKTSTTSVPVSATTTGTPRPWEDTNLSPQARYDSWKEVLTTHLKEVLAAGSRDGVSLEERARLAEDPENKKLLAELKRLNKETPEQFCSRIGEECKLRELLGKNFLGAMEWKAQGIDVGIQPPFPASITKELLISTCPINPPYRILDTHVLMLVPKTVDGAPFTALKLDELCAGRKGSGNKLIKSTDWKDRNWARAPQAQSEWVLIPKIDPDSNPNRFDNQFRGRSTDEQKRRHIQHYPQYREARVIEVMTMALLYDLTHRERLLSDYYVRCKDLDRSSNPIEVGFFVADGMRVIDNSGIPLLGHSRADLSLALARK